MDAAKFISQLSSTSSLGSDAYHELVVLAEKYPWFAAAHILQAKCLFNQNKYGFKQSLKKAAIYTGDREVLYDVMYNHIKSNGLEVENTSIAKPVIEQKEVIETSPSIEEKIVEPVLSSEEPPATIDTKREIELEKNPTQSDSETVIELREETTIPPQISEVKEVILPIEKLASQEKRKVNEPPLNMPIPDSNLESDLEEIPSVESSKKEVVTTIENTSEVEVVYHDPPEPAQLEQEIVEVSSEIEKTIPDEEIEDVPFETAQESSNNKVKTKRSPLDDIPSILKNDKKVKDPKSALLNTIQPIYDPERELQKLIAQEKENEPTETSISQPTKEKHDFLSWLSNVAPETKPETIKQPKKLPMSDEAKKLLDNFIKNRPSVGKLRPLNTQESNQPTTSESPVIEAVSESLAILFLKQELPEKAIEVYRKLQLQNPQKFSYFAALIEKVENNVTGTIRK